MRQRFRKEGLESFEDHQALELLLFYAIPRKDTNPIAHRLMDKFGSLSNVLNADIADLAAVEGLGESSATLVKLVSEIARKSWIQPDGDAVRLTNIASAMDLAGKILHGKPHEQFYVICLSAQFKMLNYDCIGKGTTSEAPVFVRHVVECAMRCGADKILVAHNHPGGNASPSQDDIATTIKIAQALDAIGIRFLDHVIIAEGDAYSFVEHDLIQNGFTADQARTSQYSGRVRQSSIRRNPHTK